MEDQSPEVPLQDLPLFNFIRQKYLPASLNTATIRMTTLEIVEQVSQHMGLGLDSMSVFNWLTENGYTYDTVGEMRFEWLMKEAA